MKNRLLLSVVFVVFGYMAGFSQITQTIRGKVVDVDSRIPLIGVNVVVMNTDPLKGAITDINGNYKITGVPLGRYSVKYSYISYKEKVLNDIVVNSGKEVILDVDLQESVTDLAEVVITSKRAGEASNEMAVISSREFSVQETQKYAGSRGEPARMARNYAGVVSSDDSRNDIVVRGNTPLGVLWRLEGINIPNPNHFAIPGTGGGPVTILNNKFLANSDFFTAAFPAEYANGIAGVFDLKMRNGNNENFEGSAQFGFLGTELMLEGPISKKKGASFLVMYRYSTLSIMSKLGIDLGTNSRPTYQDGAFRFNFPLKHGGNIAFFGIGGYSDIPILVSNQTDTLATELYGDNDSDQYFGSTMGVVGLSYTKPLNKSTFIKTVVSASHQRIHANHDKIVRHVEGSQFVVTDTIPIMGYVFRDNKYSAYFSLTKKVNRHLSFKAGLNLDLYDLHYIDSVRVTFLNETSTALDSVTPWRLRWNSDNNPMLIQPYVQFKYNASDKMIITGGLTSTFFTISKNAISPIEPRLGISYRFKNGHKLNFGTGLHSQTLAPYLYYFDKNDSYSSTLTPYNLDLGLLKSYHVVLGYEHLSPEGVRFKVETYYQYLFNLPIKEESSAYSLLNSGSGFSRFFPDKLVSEGTGRNYGLDLTLEKSFSRGYYFMVTESLYDAKYRGSDGVLRNSTFNGRFVFNFMGGKEFKFGQRRTLNLGIKVTTAGGQRYGILDYEASNKEQDIIYLDYDYNEFQFKDYFRTDLKIAYKLNTYKLTHEFGIDISNLFDTKNVLSYTFSTGTTDPIHQEYQIGRLPIFYYKLDF
ncbi:MAG: TonB-dependent receptor [Saprospiraceae bacterium]